MGVVGGRRKFFWKKVRLCLEKKKENMAFWSIYNKLTTYLLSLTEKDE